MAAEGRLRHPAPMPDPHASSGYRALRAGRHSLPGQVYLLTTVAHGRQPLFLEWSTASAVCRILAEGRLWRGSQPLCWVLMPDHLHMLARLGSREPLSRLMQRLKAVTATAANTSRGNAKGAVWMPGYHDHGVRREEAMPAIARYIVANPVRAGLVDRVGSYPYWDALWLDPAESRRDRASRLPSLPRDGIAPLPPLP